MIPKGSGSENNSWLRMADPGGRCGRDQDLRRRLRPRRRRQDVPADDRRRGHRRQRRRMRPSREDRAPPARSGRIVPIPTARSSRRLLTNAVNMLGVGPQGLGGDATAFAVHVELAATHITMNPVAVNMQCHSGAAGERRC